MWLMDEPSGTALRPSAITRPRYGVIPVSLERAASRNRGGWRGRDALIRKHSLKEELNQIIMVNLFNESPWEGNLLSVG